MDEMTHERCSEQLPEYVRGELAREQAQAVEAHLATCSDCSAERDAVIALQGTEPQPLTEIERARMRRVVLEQAVPVPEADAPAPAASRGGRLFPLLGAAALVILVAVFAYVGVGGDDGVSDGAGTALQEAERNGDDSAGEGAGGGDVGMAEDADTLEDTAAGSAARAAPPRPRFEASIGEIDSKYLNNLGRRGLELVVFSRSYTTDDVDRLRDDYTERMARAAPTARADQLRECVAQITSNFPTALPAYSAIGDFTDEPQREVLVVAFAWTDEPAGPLDQSMVWAWPLGTCDSVAHYSKNVIQPRG